MIYGECEQKLPVKAEVCLVRSFNKDELLSDLGEAPWQVMHTYDDIDDKWSYWRDLFLSVVDRHAPLVKVRIRKRGQDADWIDSELRALMRARNYHRKKHRETHNQEEWDKFKTLCKEVNRRVRVAKAEHYRSVCKNFSHQSKSTWKQLNLALGRNKHGAINTIKCDGKALTQTKEIVDSFIQHFSSIKSTSPNPDCQLQPVTTNFRFTKISEEAVLRKLTTLNERKATGPDRISAKLLIQC